MNADLKKIGAKLKDLRNQTGLTQQELADRTELTKGYISQLEHGTAAPSIMTLLDILECRGSGMPEFFKETTEEQIVFQKEDYFEKEEEGQVIQWLIPTAQKMMMEPIMVDLEPESMTALDRPHDGEEFGFVLNGEIYIMLGDHKFHAKKGESFYFPADKKHQIKAGKKGAKFLWISTPPTF